MEQWFYDAGHDEPPPEEVPCEVCEGAGEVNGTIAVEDLAKLMEEARAP